VEIDLVNEKYFAFNVWDIFSAKAVIEVSAKIDRPIFLQVSSRVFNNLDKEEFVYVVKRYAALQKAKIVLHLDHSKDLKQIEKAIKLGWDSVMFDGSHLPLYSNIELTKQARLISSAHGVLLEAEIGQIKGIEDEIIVDSSNDISIFNIKEFVESTNIDLLAVPIGTAHGQYGEYYPTINYDLIHKIHKTTKTPFVIHGGSELTNAELIKLFSMKNVKKINISTDIKQAYRRGLILSESLGLLNESHFDAKSVDTTIKNCIQNCIINKFSVLEGL